MLMGSSGDFDMLKSFLAYHISENQVTIAVITIIVALGAFYYV